MHMQLISIVPMFRNLIVQFTKAIIDEMLKKLNNKFGLTDNGYPSFHLGINIEKFEDCIKISQRTYIESVVKRFNMENSYPVETPAKSSYNNLSKDDCPKTKEEVQNLANKGLTRELYQQIFGSVLFASLNTRPDITHDVQLMSKYLQNPGQKMFDLGYQILRYLNATKNYGIKYYFSNETETSQLDQPFKISMEGYSDSDFAMDKDDRKSVSGYIIFLNKFPITWSSKKQPCVSTSTQQAELIAMCEAVKEMKFLHFLLEDLKLNIHLNLILYGDNNAAIQMCQNESQHDKSKHIEIKYFYIREQVKSGNLQLAYVNTKDNIADIFTKCLDKIIFTRLRDLLTRE
jgi:hypothetical protein